MMSSPRLPLQKARDSCCGCLMMGKVLRDWRGYMVPGTKANCYNCFSGDCSETRGCCLVNAARNSENIV